MTLPYGKVCRQMLLHIGMNVRVEKAAEKRPRKFQVQLRKLGQKGF